MPHFKWDAEKDLRLRQLYNRRIQWRSIAEELGCNSWQAEARATALKFRREKPVGRQSAILTVTVTQEVRDAVHRMAEEKGVSRSFLVTRLLEQGMRSARQA